MIFNSKITILYTVIALLLLVSCTKDIEIVLPEHTPRLVVNSAFTPDSLWAVSVTHDRQTLDTAAIKNIENATVELFENGTLLETLTYITPEDLGFGGDFGEQRGYYKSLTNRPQAGRNYSLKVAAEGYESVETSDIAPAATVEIESFDFIGVDAQGATNFELKLKDIGADMDYYHILLLSQYASWSVEDGDTSYYENGEQWQHFFLSSLANEILETEGVEVYTGNHGYLYSDDLFNGNTKTIDMTVWGLAETGIDYPNFGTSLSIRAVVRTVSEAYYKYQNSFALQYYNDGEPFAEPVLIYNNIENGFGNFSGYSSVESQTIVFD